MFIYPRRKPQDKMSLRQRMVRMREATDIPLPEVGADVMELERLGVSEEVEDGPVQFPELFPSVVRRRRFREWQREDIFVDREDV